MEGFFEFMFGASGRINRAKYWRSALIFYGAGLLVGVILLTAASIAAPLFIIMVVLVLIPWLLWGFSITTERLHDRDKSAWWLLVFFVLPSVLSGAAAGLQGSTFAVIVSIASFAISLWAVVELGFLRGTPGSNQYGPDPLAS
jgi:uncharacterized membrane protein YhaH (DUF805 family)